MNLKKNLFMKLWKRSFFPMIDGIVTANLKVKFIEETAE